MGISMEGLVLSNSLKSSRLISRTLISEIAFTVAERGLSSINPISPKTWPSPRVATVTSFFPDLLRTSTAPERTTKAEVPLVPSSMTDSPGSNIFRVPIRIPSP